MLVIMVTSQDLLDDLVSLPRAAEMLGLHRGTVNEMVNCGRLRGFRLGPHWYVRRSELDLFKEQYRRPKNAPLRRNGQRRAYWTEHLVRWLSAWENASVEELSRVVDLHVGNIRKYLTLGDQAGLFKRDDEGLWRLTDAGRELAGNLPRAGAAEG